MSDVLDGYILELYKKNRPLAKVLQFVLFQINRIDKQIANIPELENPAGPENASLILKQGPSNQELPVSDRTVWTHFISTDQTAFQIGVTHYNRFNTTADSVIRGILPVTNGQRALIVNLGPNLLTLAHKDGSVPVANRIYCVGSSDIVLPPDEMAMLWRDEVSVIWRAWQL